MSHAGNDRPVLLTRDCPTGGCGAKIGPAELRGFLSNLPALRDDNLLVGFDASDDAAVYRLNADVAIVSTVDFFPPMVDNPKTFGRIAAANAMSDIYAMGGQVLFALNLVCFPEKMDKAILGEILVGGAEKIAEAGAVVAGGHSIYASGLKYGLAVTGRVHPDRVRRNNSCQVGDCLILTKALGVGLVLSAARAGMASGMEYEAAVHSMERLNKDAAGTFAKYPVNAVTDVTGFGLAVHAGEMAGDDKTLVLNFDSLPLLPGARRFAGEYLATAAGQRNRNHMTRSIAMETIKSTDQEILFDPQTSGGLLVSVPMDDADALCREIRESDPAAAIIGMVAAREGAAVMVV